MLFFVALDLVKPLAGEPLKLSDHMRGLLDQPREGNGTLVNAAQAEHRLDGVA
jgi:hypothetical protein